MDTYFVNYADHEISYSFRYPSTYKYFKKYINKSDKDNADCTASDEKLERVRAILPDNVSDDFVEYRSMIGMTAKELLKYHCCLFHAVSFTFQNHAWLLTAPSGTGKTTQYKNWKKMYPEEIEMICGDIPVISMNERQISIHPSSWNGKENYGNMISAPLGGVIILQQGHQNTIEKMPVSEAILPMMNQFISLPDTEQQVQSLISILDCILDQYPVYKMINDGSLDSTRMLREFIEREISNEKV